MCQGLCCWAVLEYCIANVKYPTWNLQQGVKRYSSPQKSEHLVLSQLDERLQVTLLPLLKNQGQKKSGQSLAKLHIVSERKTRPRMRLRKSGFWSQFLARCLNIYQPQLAVNIFNYVLETMLQISSSLKILGLLNQYQCTNCKLSQYLANSRHIY